MHELKYFMIFVCNCYVFNVILNEHVVFSELCLYMYSVRGADKSLARPERKQANVYIKMA